jgi:hypothetical protein
MPTPTIETSVETKLDEIIVHLKKMDARDRIRLWGGFIRGMISIIPLAIFLWSTWYFIQHGPELMKQFADTAASSAAEYTKGQGQGIVDQLKEFAEPKK